MLELIIYAAHFNYNIIGDGFGREREREKLQAENASLETQTFWRGED